MALTQPPSSCSFSQRRQEEWSGAEVSPLPLRAARRADPSAGAALVPAGQSRAGLGRAEPAGPARCAAGGPGAPGLRRERGQRRGPARDAA